jgi:hypothetical protein
MDRGKVINGLEHCSEMQTCFGCPYYKCDPTCQDDLGKDALSLLKELIPRLLSYDEISNYDCVYMEFYGNKYVYPELNYEARTWAKEKYGKYWRCWSNNPTEEQRKAMKWDD